MSIATLLKFESGRTRNIPVQTTQADNARPPAGNPDKSVTESRCPKCIRQFRTGVPPLVLIYHNPGRA